MHVGLNLVFLVPDETGGMEIYARHLIESLGRVRPDIRLTAFINRNAAGQPGPWYDIEHVTVPVNSRNRVAWVLADQLLVPPLARRAKVDLLHSPANIAPAWGGPYRRLITVHDLIHKTFPEAHEGIKSRAIGVIMPLAIRRSHRLITDSHAAKQDLVTILGEPEAKIDVIPLGLDQPHAERALPEAEIRKWLDLGERQVVLSLSAKRPHKNLKRLIDATAGIPSERRPVLVIPGYPTWYERELEQHARERSIQADVRLLGWIDEGQLEGLYAVASCVLFPSLYEGFGLPVLEAMQRGVPVACSNTTSLPEVAGDAALLFDPESTEQIAAAIERLLSDPDEAERLRRRGRERVKQFTWDATGRLTAETYERALSR
jgi:glycosyltransferase involved in cell wall biosynthesis